MAAVSSLSGAGSSPTGVPPTPGNGENNEGEIPDLSEHDIQEMMIFYARRNQYATISTLCAHYPTEHIVKARESDTQMSTVHWFSLAGNFVAVEEILKRPGGGELIAARDIHGRTPLHLASIRGHIELVQLFLAYGADVEERDSAYATPLLLAAQNNHCLLVLYLLDLGADRDACDTNGCSIVHWAAFKGSTDILSLLHKRGMSMDFYDDCGYTPLHRAILGMQPGAVKHLLFKANASGNTPTRPPENVGEGNDRPLTPRQLVAQLRTSEGSDANAWMKLQPISSFVDSWIQTNAIAGASSVLQGLQGQAKDFLAIYGVHLVWLSAVLVTAITWWTVLAEQSVAPRAIDHIGIVFFFATIVILLYIQFRAKNALVDPYHIRFKKGPVLESVAWRELPDAHTLASQYEMSSTAQTLESTTFPFTDGQDPQESRTHEEQPLLRSSYQESDSFDALFLSNPRPAELQHIQPENADERLEKFQRLVSQCCIEPKTKTATASAASQLLSVSRILSHGHVGGVLQSSMQSQLCAFDKSVHLELIPEKEVLQEDTALSDASTSLLKRPLSHVERLVLDTLPLRSTNLRDDAICYTSEVPKALRSKHDAMTDCRYSGFDHFCGWLGCVVCESNHPAFVIFMLLHVVVNACWLWLLFGKIALFWSDSSTFSGFLIDAFWYKGGTLLFYGLLTHLLSVVMIAALCYFHINNCALRGDTTNEMMNRERYAYLNLDVIFYPPGSENASNPIPLEQLAFSPENPMQRIQKELQSGAKLTKQHRNPFSKSTRWRNLKAFFGMEESTRLSIVAAMLRRIRVRLLRDMWFQAAKELGIEDTSEGQSYNPPKKVQELMAAFAEGKGTKAPTSPEPQANSENPQDDYPATPV